MPNLAELFDRSGGKPILYAGRMVRASFALAVESGDKVSLTFERFERLPVQGLRLALEAQGGQLEIFGQRASEFVLWTDTAPREVQVVITTANNKKASLVLWNVWRDTKHGTMLYGVNNAAMDVIPEEGLGALLRCSDGWLGPDFDDLVVRVALPMRGERQILKS